MTQINPTILQAAGALATTFPKPLLDPYATLGTKYSFDLTQGYDCVDAIAAGVISNGATIHNLIAGAPAATTVVSGTVQTLAAGKLGIVSTGSPTLAGGTLLGTSVAAYDMSVHPSNDFLVEMAVNWNTVGPYFSFGNCTSPNTSAAQYAFAAALNAGFTMQGCVSGFKADGTTAVVAQLSFDGVLTGYISGTTAYITAVTNGILRPGAGSAGQLLAGTGMTANTHLMAQLTSTEPDGSLGKRGTYTVDTSQTLFSAGTPGTITARSVILGATTVYQMHWGPQYLEVYINGVLQNTQAGVAVPNTISSTFNGATQYYDSQLGYKYRFRLEDLIVGGWTANGAPLLAAQSYAFYRQRLTDLGIA